jgi:hypothetical protein
MQLISVQTRRLIPMVITTGIITSAFAFSYNAIGHSEVKTVISSPSIDKFMQQTNDNYYSQLSMKLQFDQRVIAWRNNTMLMSFAEQIVNEKNFKEIIAMGKDIVPFIVDEISKKPSPLVWSLNIIFNKTISNNPNTTIEQACKLWVKALS